MLLAAWISIGVALVCSLVIALDEARHPQAMGFMNVVWPVTALYFSIFGLLAYLKLGRNHTREAMQQKDRSAREGPPSLAQVAVGTSHCGGLGWKEPM